MFHFNNIGYYITVHQKIEILGTDKVLILSPGNGVKTRNPNNSNITCKPR